ncbi:hypothetical protein PoB_005714600 [Plakobranchus ocellatus]|uniref:Uncharacterized protein n=1 Tax=Plakobranchus ocellatus TaxID=259542 RepID=A0AAV4C5P8_9GAST|nr:hypothetical protein PoB_005714600 [Plakobranchus ocellatus]
MVVVCSGDDDYDKDMDNVEDDENDDDNGSGCGGDDDVNGDDDGGGDGSDVGGRYGHLKSNINNHDDCEKKIDDLYN